MNLFLISNPGMVKTVGLLLSFIGDEKQHWIETRSRGAGNDTP